MNTMDKNDILEYTITKVFKSIDNKHSCTLTIYPDISLENICYFSINNLEYEHYKTFLLLLKRTYEYMCNNNVKYIKQFINIEDVELFRNSHIIYINNNNNNDIIVKTNIVDFIDEICYAVGIQQI